jgi:hypothetical protein
MFMLIVNDNEESRGGFHVWRCDTEQMTLVVIRRSAKFVEEKGSLGMKLNSLCGNPALLVAKVGTAGQLCSLCSRVCPATRVLRHSLRQSLNCTECERAMQTWNY